jgi:hypothetical protein
MTEVDLRICLFSVKLADPRPKSFIYSDLRRVETLT